MAAAVIPKMFVFDLDNCVWNPEMYQLWGSGGPPFVRNADNTCSSHGGSGEKVWLCGDVQAVWATIHTDPKYAESKIGIASCCDEPKWAAELLNKFEVVPGKTLQDCVAYAQIHKGSKSGHFRELSRDSGIPVEDMVFFDDQRGNIQTVSAIGVTSILTPDGVEQKHFDQALEQYAQSKQ
eukprot:gene21610-25089_t